MTSILTKRLAVNKLDHPREWSKVCTEWSCTTYHIQAIDCNDWLHQALSEKKGFLIINQTTKLKFCFLHNICIYNVFIFLKIFRDYIWNVSNQNQYFDEIMHTFGPQLINWLNKPFIIFTTVLKLIEESNYSSIVIHHKYIWYLNCQEINRRSYSKCKRQKCIFW